MVRFLRLIGVRVSRSDSDPWLESLIYRLFPLSLPSPLPPSSEYSFPFTDSVTNLSYERFRVERRGIVILRILKDRLSFSCLLPISFLSHGLASSYRDPLTVSLFLSLSFFLSLFLSVRPFPAVFSRNSKTNEIRSKQTTTIVKIFIIP